MRICMFRSRFIPPADCYCLHTTARLLQPTERRGGTLSANKMGIIIIVGRKRIMIRIKTKDNEEG